MKLTATSIISTAILLAPGIGFSATLPLPPTIIIPNYDRALIGQIPGLEAGAYIARVDDPSSSWYNPAGLLHSKRTEVNTSSSAYGWTALKTSAASGPNLGAVNGNDIPGYFGLVIGSPVISSDRMRVGFSIARQLTWTPTLQSQILVNPSTGTTQQLDYSIRDNLNQFVPTVALAYSPEENLRLGISANAVSTSYQGSDSIAQQQLTLSNQTNLNRFSQINGNVLNLFFALGGQYDLSDHWKMGVYLKSPSVRLWGSATLTYNGLDNSNGSITSTTFYDNGANFRYNESFQSNIGIAYRSHSFELEGDLRYHAAVGSYSLFSSSNNISVASSTGGAPTLSTQPFSNINNSFNNVLNFAFGGKYEITERVGVHAGFFTSYSPVENNSGSAFRKIDLYGVSAGASVVIGSFSGSLGAEYEWGTSDSFIIANTLAGQPIDSDIKINSLKILYAVTFKL